MAGRGGSVKRGNRSIKVTQDGEKRINQKQINYLLIDISCNALSCLVPSVNSL